MRALVTGSAGFVGSHLAERLAREGWEVVGVDCLTAYYDVDQKRSNLAELLVLDGFEHHELDLRNADLTSLLDGVDVVFHQAGQPGVRTSWEDFDAYVQNNIGVTQRLLEAARHSQITRFVFASSSSVYGNAVSYPTTEDTLPRPHSPYGVTKLAAEQLCGVYARNWGVPTVSLRYFTVFGPRQRPDMAMHRLIDAALSGAAFPLYGSGDQIRDYTFVADVVAANMAAARAAIPPGMVFNIAGGGAITVVGVIEMIERLTGRSILLDRRPVQAGDAHRTGAAIEASAQGLAWAPRVTVEEGLAHQVRWQTERGEGDHGTLPAPHESVPG